VFARYLGKYKSIIISIALFIILDASVLILNFYISFEIAEDAVGVNIAGRQRMLSQRMVKSLLDIYHSNESTQDQNEAIEELKFTQGLFDQTLNSFDEGGVVQSAGGGEVKLSRVTSLAGREAIEEAKVMWLPYNEFLSTITTDITAEERGIALPAAIAYAKRHNLKLLTLMNDLTIDLENVATSKATRLRMIQTVGITLAIINFFIILFHFIGELRKGDKRLDVARQETKKILDTVNEGLFLVDKGFIIASQHSKKLSSMFGKRDISGLSLEGLLADLVTRKDMETSKRFISLLFRKDIKSSLIGDLNPLREIEVNIFDEAEGYTTKYLRFEFARAYENGNVKNILVTVNDVTEKVKLEKELEIAREQTEQQLEVLTGILHANPVILKRFVSACFEGFHRINLLLREPAKSTPALRKKLNDIFIEIHAFKGEAGALGLESFQKLAHKFETDIVNIRERKEIIGDDFFPLVVQLDKLIRHAESVQGLSNKLAAFAKADLPVAAAETGEWEHLHHLTESIAVRSGKKVELITSGLTEVALNVEMAKLISDVSMQCIRNAIFHGIESPRERVEHHKSEVGRIDLRLAQVSDGGVELSIRDDGRGFDYDAIRERAIASGLWSEQELESWDSKQLASLIFEPGFSTSPGDDVDAGRGVGMNVVKEKVMDFRGRIRISSRRGTSTHFLMSIPPALGGEKAA